MKKIYIFFFLVLLQHLFFSQSKTNAILEKIPWKKWSEIEALQAKEPRAVMVWIYADWCSHCKDLKEQSLSDKNVIRALCSDKVYVVKLNVEEKNDIIYKGKVYKYVPATKEKKAYHELAFAMMHNTPGIPSLVFFDENLRLLQELKGFRNPNDLQIIMPYFFERKYVSMNWADYAKNIKLTTSTADISTLENFSNNSDTCKD